MSRWRFSNCWLALLAAPAAGQGVELGVTQVDASPLGPDYVTADVYINVLDEPDWWTVGGIVGDVLMPGLQHHRLLDPNTGDPVFSAPGRDTPQQEFATFVSLPREQFSDQRFGENGRAAIPTFSGVPGPPPTLDPTRIFLAFFQFPPSTNGNNVPDTGFIIRVTLENDPAISGYSTEGIVVATSPAPGVPLAEYTAASATKNVPTPLAEMDFGFYWIPEPSSFALLAASVFVCGAFGRRVERPQPNG